VVTTTAAQSVLLRVMKAEAARDMHQRWCGMPAGRIYLAFEDGGDANSPLCHER
jgi:hypothetical protein